MPKPKQSIKWETPPHPIYGFLLPEEFEQAKRSCFGGAAGFKSLSASRARQYNSFLRGQK